MIRMPVPLTRKYQVLVTNCSSVWLDKVLRESRAFGPYYRWLRGCMDEADTYNYPKTLSEQIFFESNPA